MKKMLSVALASISGLLLVAGFAYAADSNPFLGAWILDAAHSSTTQPLPMRETRNYGSEGPDSVTVIVEGTDAYGENYAYGASGELDGRVWPLSGRDEGARVLGDSIAWRRIDASTVQMDIKKKGQTLYVTRHNVSADGKTLTVTENGTDDESRPIHDIRVYHRQ